MKTHAPKLPNLIIAGVHKAGTTSLYSYLAKHSQICASYKKEVGYFTPLIAGGSLPSLEGYAQNFEHCTNELFRMEASPSYLYGKEVIATSIRDCLGPVKIIVILRDPTDRLVSFFSRAISKSGLPSGTSFEEYVKISAQHLESDEQSVYARGLREGIYMNYIPAWQDIFGRDMKILFFDDLKSNARDLVVRTCNWLGIGDGEYKEDDFSIENKTKQYRHKSIHQRIRNYYMQHEAFWRRHHKLKRRIRDVYNRFNAAAEDRPDSVDSTTISWLHEFYAPYNEQLGRFLMENGHESVPRWLTNHP